MRKKIVVLAAVTAILLCGLAAQAAVTLPRMKIDTGQTSVSGLSSGGFMANQLGYAYSSSFFGVGVFAAGPYMCAGHSNYTACMYNASISTMMLNTMQADINNWSDTAIDNKSNIARQKIYLFIGSIDTTIGPNPMNAVQTQYAANGVAAANLEYVKRARVAHTFPTDFDSSGDSSCSSSASPYISNCGYDGAKAVLTKFYGPLNARNNAPAAANYIEFDQTAFTTNAGMAPTGWAYVPSVCASGSTCRLHVALHGCKQNYATIGDKFIKNTGYSRWADTNRIVVLFPQTRVDNTSRPTSASGSLANPNGCWDWIGWYGSNFAQRVGSQQTAIKAMVDHLSSGSSSGGTLPAPSGVTTSAATSNSMTIGWTAVAGARGYNVYRNGAKSNPAPVPSTGYTDGDLAPATHYSWSVAAVDGSGLEGASSAPVTGTTTGAAAVCFTASNYAHVGANRAYTGGFYTYANGSNQNIGLWNVFVTTTLRRTGSDYYVIGSCS